MLAKLINLIGRQANLAVSLLAVLVAANVLVQLYTHKTTALTAWKGGGFGMYTEPHAEDRSVWIQLVGADSTANIRLWPASKEFLNWRELAGVAGRAFLDDFQQKAERMRFYPRNSGADALVNRASRVRWPENLVGETVPKQGRVFAKSDIRVIVYENSYELAKQTVTRRVVFERKAGDK